MCTVACASAAIQHHGGRTVPRVRPRAAIVVGDPLASADLPSVRTEGHLKPFLRAVIPGLLVVVSAALVSASASAEALGTLTGCYALVVYGTGALLAVLLLMAAGLVLTVSILEQSYSMAYREELTRLPARRALMRDLPEASGVYTIAMVDVDHFKKFNDTYGHDVGDQALQLVATRLASSREGAAYRYGGEEFTLVWKRPRNRPSGKDEKRKKKPKKRPRTLSVPVRIGLADSSAGGGSPEAILKKADQALYRAKEKGRNQVSLQGLTACEVRGAPMPGGAGRVAPASDPPTSPGRVGVPPARGYFAGRTTPASPHDPSHVPRHRRSPPHRGAERELARRAARR